MGILSHGLDNCNLWVRWFNIMTCVGSWTENFAVMSAITLKDTGRSLLERTESVAQRQGSEQMISLLIYGALSMHKVLWGTTQENDFITIRQTLEVLEPENKSQSMKGDGCDRPSA